MSLCLNEAVASAAPALKRPLSTMGVERTLCMLPPVVRYVLYRSVSVVAGRVVFSGLCIAAFAAHRRDPLLGLDRLADRAHPGRADGHPARAGEVLPRRHPAGPPGVGHLALDVRPAGRPHAWRRRRSSPASATPGRHPGVAAGIHRVRGQANLPRGRRLQYNGMEMLAVPVEDVFIHKRSCLQPALFAASVLGSPNVSFLHFHGTPPTRLLRRRPFLPEGIGQAQATSDFRYSVYRTGVELASILRFCPLESQSARHLEQTAGTRSTDSLSPDRRSVILKAGRNIRSDSIDGDEPITLCELPVRDPFAWSPIQHRGHKR